MRVCVGVAKALIIGCTATRTKERERLSASIQSRNGRATNIAVAFGWIIEVVRGQLFGDVFSSLDVMIRVPMAAAMNVR